MKHIFFIWLAFLALLLAQPADARKKRHKVKARPRHSVAIKPKGKVKIMVHPKLKLTVLNSAGLPRGASPFIEKQEAGHINWTAQYIEAEGEANLEPERYKNPTQARAMAIRAASQIARRNLLELIKGVIVSPETTVEDLLATREPLAASLQSLVKNTQPFRDPSVVNSTLTVQLRIPLYTKGGLAHAVYAALPKPDTTLVVLSASVGAAPTSDTPLLLDIHGQPFAPALFPVVTDSAGGPLLDMRQLYNPETGTFPALVTAGPLPLQAGPAQLHASALPKKGSAKANKVKPLHGPMIVDVQAARAGKIVLATTTPFSTTGPLNPLVAAIKGKYIFILL